MCRTDLPCITEIKPSETLVGQKGMSIMRKDLIEMIGRAEALFPQTFADMVERDWGVLFVTPTIPDSHDGNHACVLNHYDDVTAVVDEIVEFYEGRGVTPRVNYISSDGDNPTLRQALEEAGFAIGHENAMRVYLHQSPSSITPNPDVRIRQIKNVDTEMFDALASMENQRSAKVLQRCACRADDWLFVGKIDGQAASVALLQRTENICRVDEVYTAESHRRKGCSRAVIDAIITFYKNSQIAEPLYLWTDNPIAERIYLEAGFIKLEHSFVNWSAWKEK